MNAADLSRDLPSKVDAIILGTGLTQCVLASAFSIAGKKVLTHLQFFSTNPHKVIHIDENEFYGETFASLSLIEFKKWLERYSVDTPSITNLETIKDDLFTKSIEELRPISRHFCVDISPQLLLCQGETISLLARTGVARYLDFKFPDRFCYYDGDFSKDFISIPLSRSDIFLSSYLSLTEKTLLSKFFKWISELSDYDDFDEEYIQLSPKEFLERHDLTPKLQRILFSSVSQDSTSDLLNFLVAIQKYIHSLGIYGDYPMLSCLYGTSEICQAFCRVAALNGGTYIMNMPIDRFLLSGVEEGEEEAMVETIVKGFDKIELTNGDRRRKIAGVSILGNDIKADYVISSLRYMKDPQTEKVKKKIFVRALVISTAPPLHFPNIEIGADGVGNIFAIIPAEAEINPSSQACTFLSFDHRMGVCKEGYRISYLQIQRNVEIGESNVDSERMAMKSMVKNLFSDESLCYFGIYECNRHENLENLPENVSVLHSAISMDECIDIARMIFGGYVRDAEFIPELPNPEDIELLYHGTPPTTP